MSGGPSFRIVAIDGPAGSGKSTISRRVAEELGFRYVDTGAMYRAVAWHLLSHGIDLENRDAVAAEVGALCVDVYARADGMGVRVNGLDVTGEIRSEEVSKATSRIAAVPEVRNHLVSMYRSQGASGDVVMEGRDIGTVAFPEAPLKIYLTASPATRAQRRLEQHPGKNGDDLGRVEEAIRRRDERDSGREHAPLVPAADAVEIDTTELSIEEVAARILSLARERLRERSEV